jgi:hypothetical protein
MAVMPTRLIRSRAVRREITSSFFRAFTPLGWMCWLFALAGAAYLSWTMARLCVVWMAT